MSANDVPDPLEELQRENDVIKGITERILEVALLLKDGKDVPVGEVAEELRLFEQYLTLHIQRMDRELQPEARPVAMTTCYEHLDRLVRDHEAESQRIREARAALEEYGTGVPHARARLGELLEKLANQGYEVSVYEGDYPLSCLISTLPEDAAQRVGAKFSATQGEVADLDQHVQKLLKSPAGHEDQKVAVRCAQDGCTRSDEAQVVPGPQGQLGLIPPVGGWEISSQKVEVRGDDTVRVHLTFRCPDHLVPAEESSGTPAPLPTLESGGTP